MPSNIDIINVALRRVGARRINSLADDSDEAAVAGDVYDNTLDELLRAHFWNFATKREKLARETDVPTFQFDFAYALPSDWIRTVSVHPDDSGVTHMLYKEELIEGQKTILASTEDVYMRYIARITDPNIWSADFRDVVSYNLARDMAIVIASSNTLLTNLDALARRALAKARSSDSMGSSPERRPRGSWVTRRGTSRPIVGSST